MRCACLLLSAVLLSCAAPANGSDWTNVGPEIGTAASLAFDPHDPAIAYLGAGSGIYKTSDAGITWNHTGLAGWRVMRIFIDPQNTSNLYAQGNYPVGDDDSIAKVFKSRDGRASWGDILTESTLLAVNGDTLYTLAGNGQGLYKSTDGAATWAPLSGLPAGLFVSALAVDWANPQTVYATLQGTVAAHTVVTLYKSTDGGATWKQSDSGLLETFSLDGNTNALPFAPNGIIVDRVNPATLYAPKYAGGVYKSTDAGATWHAANSGMPNNPSSFPICCPSGMTIDPGNPNILYAGGLNPTGLGIYRSANGGSSWTAVTPLSGAGLQPLFIDLQGAVYAPVSGGVRKSPDGGATWTIVDLRLHTAPVFTMSIDAQGTLFAGTDPISRSGNGGVLWTPANSGIPEGYNIIALAADPQTPNTLYAAADTNACGPAAGIYKTVDGANWADQHSGTGCGISAVALDAQIPSIVYAGSRYRGVFKSIDGGIHWAPVNSGLPDSGSGISVSALAADPQHSGTVYASVAGGLFKTIDGGATWTDTGLTSSPVALTIDPQNSGVIYAASPDGLSQSADSGTNWQNVFAPGSSGVFAAAVDLLSSATVYAATDAGVFQSTDGGSSWTLMPGSPALVRVLALGWQGSNQTLYAGGPGGLFSTTLP
jgi:hypothetical protein